MRRFLKILFYLVGALVIAVGSALIWAYSPVPSFEPASYAPTPPDDWPTQEWRRSTPEEQGMNSDTLLDMVAYYQAEAAQDPNLYLDSVTVIRNGVIVAELYPNPNYSPDQLHVIHSATKSIVSALIGIAIDRGAIESVDAKVIDFFPGRTFKNMDDRKRAMTVRDLLSMETGLHSRDSYLYGHEGLLALQQSDDWVQFALDLPMAATPGERFDYSNISTFLLGAVLAKATNTDVLTFARATLFDPLGIDDVEWDWTKDGLPIAWARMWMKPDDWAKFGLLYLQQGKWQGQQIVPAAWIKESLTPWAFPKNAVDVLKADMSRDDEASTRNFVSQRFIRSFTDGYGYQWWLDREGPYNALGTSGQFLTIAPEQNLVFAATSKSRGLAQFKPAQLFYDFVLPAIESDGPLPANPKASQKLAGYAVPPKRVDTPTPVPALPDTALKVSGKTYIMEPSPYKTNNVRLIFEPGETHAQLSYTARENWAPDFQIGLDGVPRQTETSDKIFLATGAWTAPNTFTVEVEIVGYTTFDKWEFRFEDSKLYLTEFSITGNYTYAGEAVP